MDRNGFTMNSVLLFLISGGILGYYIREKKSFLHHLDKLTFWSVLTLLFLLGLSVGRNQTIMQNLHKLGIQALILSVSAVSGSVILSWLVYKYFFKGIKADEK